MEVFFRQNMSSDGTFAASGGRPDNVLTISRATTGAMTETTVCRAGVAVFSVRSRTCGKSTRKAFIFDADGTRIATVRRRMFFDDKFSIDTNRGRITLQGDTAVLHLRKDRGSVALGRIVCDENGTTLNADEEHLPFLTAVAAAMRSVAATSRHRYAPRRIGGKLLRAGSTIAAAIAVCSSAALFSACETFHTDVTVGELPEHVKSVSITCNGESPLKWEGEYYLFDSGDKIDVKITLEQYYELGDCKMLVNGREVELTYDGVTGKYIYSFVIQNDVEITFSGTPSITARNIRFVTHSIYDGSDSKFVTVDGWEELGLEESYSFAEIMQNPLNVEIPQGEGLSFTLYSEEYRYMPTAEAAFAQGLSSFESAQPFFDGTRGGTRFVVSAANGNGEIVLNSSEDLPEFESEFNPDDMFFTFTVGGETPTPEVSMNTLIDNPLLEVTLTQNAIGLYERMKAQNVPLTLTVNGTEITDVDILETDGSVVVSAMLDPAYTYADGIANGLFGYTVSTSVSRFAASDPSLTVGLPATTTFDSSWAYLTPVVRLAEDQQYLVYSDADGDKYFATDGYVVFDVWVPVGTPTGIPSYSFTINNGTEVIDIYYPVENPSFIVDKSPVKVARTTVRDNNIDGLEGWYAVLYKVYISPATLNEGGLHIYFETQ